MRVIAFVTQKGGSGKSTLAFCCAVRAEQEGKRVLLLDLDPQATAEQWYLDRESETPNLIKLRAAQLEEAVNGARRGGYDFLIIDTPGRDEPATAAAIRAADFCVVPCRPTPGDMKATPPTIETINRLGKQADLTLVGGPSSQRELGDCKGKTAVGAGGR
jgi:chromosome partitioning protein